MWHVCQCMLLMLFHNDSRDEEFVTFDLQKWDAIVFNCLSGDLGEDGTLQDFAETAHLPPTAAERKQDKEEGRVGMSSNRDPADLAEPAFQPERTPDSKDRGQTYGEQMIFTGSSAEVTELCCSKRRFMEAISVRALCCRLPTHCHAAHCKYCHGEHCGVTCRPAV